MRNSFSQHHVLEPIRQVRVLNLKINIFRRRSGTGDSIKFLWSVSGIFHRTHYQLSSIRTIFRSNRWPILHRHTENRAEQ